ncbi:hypothetical protein ACJIZ3_004296 [Penstemon smallii]|uniref:Uncharacterized protein n=1 Tax=Penstemon smallii TaxID=265156 RepID=A0ABD3S1P8_9LAMI
MATTKYHSLHSQFYAHNLNFQEIIITSRTRKTNGLIKVSVSDSNVKRANLSARKKKRIKLPNYGEDNYPISDFFSHPSGVEAMLNTKALQSYQSLDSNLYRCILPQLQLLSFEVAPVLDLLVTPTSEDCIVEMYDYMPSIYYGQIRTPTFFSSMRNHIKWETIDAEPFLDVDVKLNLILEIYTQPFTLLPISAVEGPGNM